MKSAFLIGVSQCDGCLTGQRTCQVYSKQTLSSLETMWRKLQVMINSFNQQGDTSLRVFPLAPKLAKVEILLFSVEQLCYKAQSDLEKNVLIIITVPASNFKVLSFCVKFLNTSWHHEKRGVWTSSYRLYLTIKLATNMLNQVVYLNLQNVSPVSLSFAVHAAHLVYFPLQS